MEKIEETTHSPFGIYKTKTMGVRGGGSAIGAGLTKGAWWLLRDGKYYLSALAQRVKALSHVLTRGHKTSATWLAGSMRARNAQSLPQCSQNRQGELNNGKNNGNGNNESGYECKGTSTRRSMSKSESKSKRNCSCNRTCDCKSNVKGNSDSDRTAAARATSTQAGDARTRTATATARTTETVQDHHTRSTTAAAHSQDLKAAASRGEEEAPRG